jgi:hypothetical protein
MVPPMGMPGLIEVQVSEIDKPVDAGYAVADLATGIGTL